MAATPSKRKTPDWVRNMRADLDTGWRIHEVRERIFLTVTFSDGQRSTLQTHLPWARSSKKDLLNLCARLKDRMAGGVGLKEAYRLDEASEAITSGSNIDWTVAIEKFRAHKIGSGQLGEDVGERTWHRNYRNPMEHALQHLNSNPKPTSAIELMERMRDACTLAPGSTGRRLRFQYTAAMLRHAVTKLGADSRWEPPADISEFIGVKQKGQELTTYISDDQIVRLLASIEDPQWRAAIGVIACWGLRPVELHTISANGEMLHVGWQKRTAKKQTGTPPRDVFGLDPVGLEGLSANLLALIAERGLQALPEACRHERCGDRVGKYLQRQKVWQELVEEVAAIPTTGNTGNQLIAYSLRHAFSDRAEQMGISDKQASVMMGHSLQTHHSHYSGTTTETLARAVARAKQAMRNRQASPSLTEAVGQ